MKGRGRDIAFSVLLGLAGFLGNWYRLPLFFNIDFLFGSFFVMVAIARYGVPGGVTAGLIAGSCSYLLWNHPWAIVIFTAEALFVAVLNRRRSGDLITLDTIYWLLLGMPMAWFFYHTVMGVGREATLLVALKQSVNGIFNAMLATIVLLALPRWRSGGRQALLPFRQIIFIAMVSLALIQAFCYLMVDIRTTLSREEVAVHERVLSVSVAARDLLNDWITSNHQQIIALSRMVGDPARTPFAEMEKQVELLTRGNPYLLRAGVLDSEAVSVAFFPLIDELGRSSLGVDASDRPYLPLLRKTLKPMVGEVVISKIGEPRPILPLLAPIVIDGRYRGYCIGAVDLDRLAGHLRILVERRFTDITVLDRNGRVIVSSSKRHTPMQLFGRPAGGEVRNVGDGIYHWIPRPEKNIALLQRWRDSAFVKEVVLPGESPLKIVVEGSMVPYLATLTAVSTEDLLLLLGAIVITLLVSLLLSKQFVISLQHLAVTSTHLPLAIAENQTPEWPRSSIREVSSLIGNFKEMAAALSAHIQSLNELNQQLEGRVEQRTKELRKSEERYSRLVNTASEGIWVIDKRHRTTFANRRLAQMLACTVEEMEGRLVEEFVPADFGAEMAGHLECRRRGIAEQYEVRMNRKDGSEIWMWMSAAPLFDEEGEFYGSFAMCMDVTEQKGLREELQRANELLTQRVAERTEELEKTIGVLQEEIQERTRLGEALEAETRERLAAQAVLHENELLLLQQSRLAAMGEMIGNIAHQWRQPLNLLGLLAQELPMAYEHGHFSAEYLEENVERMLDTIQYMSKTIDDFRYFAQPSRVKVDFRLLETVEKTKSLLEGALKAQRIEMQVQADHDPVVHGYPNQFSQVLLNIIMNARDAFTSHPVNDPVIRIELEEQEGRSVMTITDNAGGIPEAVMERIFDPYFTTKGPDKGTGVGLFMSKMIIQKMGGTLSADNVEDGARFRIELGS
ncbi:PAS domain S-box protein [Geomonas sp.]|uniref:PAS domain S-box protein n=1 Tax=Geomonas sp. TaxID=2651584 RepID=UPI002B49A60A|nr:PAS domain S-box protein [Geomonas sp.]HJV34923.1 PAS domain S-box protein [Geomonas sp.]